MKDISEIEAGAATDLERTVLAAFASALGDIGTVDADTDFFEAGGDSVRGARVVAGLRQVLPVRVTIRDLFRARTPRALAAVVVSRETN